MSQWNASAAACLLLVAALVAPAQAAAYPVTAPGECVTNPEGKRVCPPADVTCTVDIFGKIFCSPPEGSILLNRFGEAVCGPGPCVPDLYGEIHCARESKGAAMVDAGGKISCKGGCVKASKEMCRTPDALK